MEFRISDTFTDSLGKLTGDEQKAVKTTAFDLQLNAASPGMQFRNHGVGGGCCSSPIFTSRPVPPDAVCPAADACLLCSPD